MNKIHGGEKVYFPDHILEPPDKEYAAVFQCERCSNSIYEGDKYFEIDCEVLCEDCVDLTYSKFAQSPEDPEDEY